MIAGGVGRLLGLLALAALVPVLAGCGESGAYGITVIGDGAHRLDGDRPGILLVAGGEATVPEGARVDGSVFVLAGSLTLDGAVAGDLNAIGGRTTLGTGASVSGDVNLSGGTVTGAEQARVGGDVVERSGVDIPFTPGWESEQPLPTRIGIRLLGAAVVGLLAAVFALLAPRPLERVGTAASTQPLVALALGLLGIVVALPLIVFMAFTGVLIPVALLTLLLLGLALAFGWSAVAVALLHRLVPDARRLGRVAAASSGAAALTLLAALAELVPVVGLVVPATLFSLAFGAVLLTRLGTRAALPAGETISAPSS